MTLALQIKNLTKTYPGGTQALGGVNLEIAQGDFFGLLGPNGAGKTTLISVVSGLTVKSGGLVKVFDVDIDQDLDQAKSFIGIVPQEFNYNMFEKVTDIIVSQAGYYGIPRGKALLDAEPILKDLALWDKRAAKAMTLSGGMKRRLMIARALIHHPKFLILDEPTAGVDVELRRGMWDYLTRLNAGGVTIILTTHYLEEAEQLCKNIAIINKGKIIESGSVKNLITKLNFVTLLFDADHQLDADHLGRLEGLSARKVDENTFEVTISPGQSINEIMEKISRAGIKVLNIRNKSSRLEEIFVNLTANQSV